MTEGNIMRLLAVLALIAIAKAEVSQEWFLCPPTDFSNTPQKGSFTVYKTDQSNSSLVNPAFDTWNTCKGTEFGKLKSSSKTQQQKQEVVEKACGPRPEQTYTCISKTTTDAVGWSQIAKTDASPVLTADQLYAIGQRYKIPAYDPDAEGYSGDSAGLTVHYCDDKVLKVGTTDTDVVKTLKGEVGRGVGKVYGDCFTKGHNPTVIYAAVPTRPKMDTAICFGKVSAKNTFKHVVDKVEACALPVDVQTSVNERVADFLESVKNVVDTERAKCTVWDVESLEWLIRHVMKPDNDIVEDPVSHSPRSTRESDHDLMVELNTQVEEALGDSLPIAGVDAFAEAGRFGKMADFCFNSAQSRVKVELTTNDVHTLSKVDQSFKEGVVAQLQSNTEPVVHKRKMTVDFNGHVDNHDATAPRLKMVMGMALSYAIDRDGGEKDSVKKLLKNQACPDAIVALDAIPKPSKEWEKTVIIGAKKAGSSASDDMCEDATGGI